MTISVLYSPDIRAIKALHPARTVLQARFLWNSSEFFRCSVRFILQVLIFFHQFDRSSSTLWITNTPVIPLPLNYIQCSVFIQSRQQKEVPPARQRLDESQVLEQVLFFFPIWSFFCFVVVMCFRLDGLATVRFTWKRTSCSTNDDGFLELISLLHFHQSFLMNGFTAKINGPRCMFILVFMCHVSSICEGHEFKG